jgi:O-antigen/teichoic acid export membrane protein
MIERAKNNFTALLRHTEKYTKTDMVYLAGGGFWLFLKVAFSTVLALLLSVAFANLIPVETYGAYKYVFTVFGLLAIPTLLGMSNAVVKAVAQGFEGTTLAALKTKVLWGTLGSFASGCFALYYFLQGNTELAGAFGLVTLFLPFFDTFNLFNSILTGKRLFRTSLIYEVAVQAVSVASVITTLFLTKELVLILASYFVAYTLTRGVALFLAIRNHTENNNVDTSALKFGKHLSAMDIVATISEAADNLLLWQFGGAAPVAIYAFAKTIPLHITTASKRLITLAFPKFASRDFASIKQQIGHKMLILFILMAGITALYWLVAPLLFTVLFPQYTEAIWYSQLFSLTLLFFPQKLIGTAFQAHARTKTLYISSTLVPLVRLALAIICIPLFGIMGALMMELGARIFNFFLMSFLLARAKP